MAGREAALEYYRLVEYAKAEAMLLALLVRGFEVASTHCQLARICLLTDRDADARNHAEQASAERDRVPPYVVARALWLQLAAMMLEVASADAADRLRTPETRGKLTVIVRGGNATMDWAMQPVLDHLAKRLAPEHHALLATLVAAMGNVIAIKELDAFRTLTLAP